MPYQHSESAARSSLCMAMVMAVEGTRLSTGEGLGVHGEVVHAGNGPNPSGACRGRREGESCTGGGNMRGVGEGRSVMHTHVGRDDSHGRFTVIH